MLLAYKIPVPPLNAPSSLVHPLHSWLLSEEALESRKDCFPWPLLLYIPHVREIIWHFCSCMWFPGKASALPPVLLLLRFMSLTLVFLGKIGLLGCVSTPGCSLWLCGRISTGWILVLWKLCREFIREAWDLIPVLSGVHLLLSVCRKMSPLSLERHLRPSATCFPPLHSRYGAGFLDATEAAEHCPCSVCACSLWCPSAPALSGHWPLFYFLLILLSGEGRASWFSRPGRGVSGHPSPWFPLEISCLLSLSPSGLLQPEKTGEPALSRVHTQPPVTTSAALAYFEVITVSSWAIVGWQLSSAWSAPILGWSLNPFCLFPHLIYQQSLLDLLSQEGPQPFQRRVLNPLKMACHSVLTGPQGFLGCVS